jgi:hypothetical protein
MARITSSNVLAAANGAVERPEGADESGREHAEPYLAAALLARGKRRKRRAVVRFECKISRIIN